MRKHKIFSKPLVLVRWNDACSWGDEYSIDHEFHLNPCETYGRLISKTKKSIVISRDIFGDGEICDYELSGVLVIPRDWVQEIVIIKSFKKKRRNIV